MQHGSSGCISQRLHEKEEISMADFNEKKQKKNKKIAESLKGYWNTPEGKKRRGKLKKRMSNPKKRSRKR